MTPLSYDTMTKGGIDPDELEADRLLDELLPEAGTDLTGGLAQEYGAHVARAERRRQRDHLRALLVGGLRAERLGAELAAAKQTIAAIRRTLDQA